MRARTFFTLLLGLLTSTGLPGQSREAAIATGSEAQAKQFRDLIGAPAEPRPAIGTKQLAVLLLQFEGEGAPAHSRDTLERLFEEANSFYREASYGQFSFVWEILGPLTLPLKAPCNAGELAAATSYAREAAAAAALDLAKYDTLVLAGSGCGPAQASLLGDSVWLLVDALDARTVAHELGHSLGLPHADYLHCPSAPYAPGPLSFSLSPLPNGCLRLEADDPYDLMGTGFHHFNAVYKERLGWLTPLEVTRSGVYRIEPIELATSSVKALKIRPPEGDPFYVEYRQPIGFDRVDSRFLQFVGVFKGALLHVNHTTSIPLSGLVAMDVQTEPYAGFPGDPQYGPLRGRPALTPGTTFVDPENRFSIKTLSATPEALAVEITMMEDAGRPRFSFGQPLDGAAVSGVTPVTIVAAEENSLTRVELRLDGNLLDSKAICNSQICRFDWDTTTVPAGVHQLAATAYGKAGETATRSINVAVHERPSVTVVALNQSVAFGESVRLLAVASTDNQTTVKSVEFLIDGPSESQRIAGTAVSNGVYALDWHPAERGIFSISAEVEDSAGFRNWSSASVLVTVSTVAVASQGVVNAASYRQPLSPGSLVTIFGGGFAENTASAQALPLPREIEGVIVTFNGESAPILFVSPRQIKVQAPWSLQTVCDPPRVISVTVSARNSVAEGSVLCSPAAPGIFRGAAPAQALATHADGSLVGPVGTVAGLASRPARPGETITLWCTGLGAVTPPASDGEAREDVLHTAISTPAVTIGGLPAEVEFAGLAPGLVGVNQLNVIVPAGVAPGPVVPVSVSAGGYADTATLAIEP